MLWRQEESTPQLYTALSTAPGRHRAHTLSVWSPDLHIELPAVKGDWVAGETQAPSASVLCVKATSLHSIPVTMCWKCMASALVPLELPAALWSHSCAEPIPVTWSQDMII